VIAEYLLPGSADAVEAELARGAALIAGGTVALPRGIDAERVVGLARAGLDGIERTRIGATATLAAVARLGGALGEAAAAVGGPALRNMATVGGNLFAGAPYGDLGVVLLALGARVEVRDRAVPLEELWAGLVAYEDVRAAAALVRAVAYDDAPAVSLRWARRAANSPAVVSVAVSGGRVTLGGVAPHPVRSPAAEALMDDPEAAGEAAAAEVDPPADAIASAWYRRRMTRVFVRRALEELHAV
jgi:CO/xanthine dehydrogenase FAD-binding subunit